MDTSGFGWKTGAPKSNSLHFIAIFQDCRRQREKHKICLPSFSPLQLEDLEAQGKGGKLAWQGAWHENTKGTAQLCSFFVNMGERVWSCGMLVRWTSKPTYWGDVCWRGRGWEHMIVMYCCTKRIRKFSIANMMTSDWGRFKGPPSASEWTFGSAGRSNAVQSRSWGREVGARAQHEN